MRRRKKKRCKLKMKQRQILSIFEGLFLTIMSSVDFEEAGHKLLKIKLEPGQEVRLESLVAVILCC
ncbi:hypothetical protein Fmac_026796 [Flemingia macrophylla]|uniref:Translation initiation factor 1 n=1 Tax=Flemingia macrophylla TaxID=520843 RepID=A0ABD1LFY4_9FABA